MPTRKFKCSKCHKDVLDIQLFPHPVLLTIIGMLQFPRDYVCAYCKMDILGVDIPVDCLPDSSIDDLEVDYSDEPF